MENSIKYFQVFILTIVMAFGITLGTSLDADAKKDEKPPCGTCFYDSETNLSFCNFVFRGGICGGNSGDDCGAVPCGS